MTCGARILDLDYETERQDEWMILDTIAASAKERVAAAKEALPLAEQIARARELDSNTGFPFEQALAKKRMSFICEVKKASPSKGLIAAEFPYVQIAKEYEAAGADAISVLTEPAYFQGKNEYLTKIRQTVQIPLLRKDFTIDEYMIYEAKNIGADAVLLICAILSPMQLSEYGARIVGVNNRNLKDFTVDIHNSVRLRELVPENILFVSESGMKTRQDIEELEQNGTNAVLIGETLMRSADKKEVLQELRGQVTERS